MKIKIIILVLAFSLNCHAQDPQLFKNTWYLQNVIINGQNNFPSSNSEVPFVDLTFNQTSMFFQTNVCNSAIGEISFDNPSSSFSFPNGLSFTLIECNEPNNGVFEQIYFDFYSNNVDDPFVYNLIDNGSGNLSLIVNSTNGDEAIYGNEILSYQGYDTSSFEIYPNPVQRELFISNKSKMRVIRVDFIDITGKLVLSENENYSKKISIKVQNLINGIYFILLKSEQGQYEVKKIIKN